MHGGPTNAADDRAGRMRAAEHVVDLMNGAEFLAVEPVSSLHRGCAGELASTCKAKPRVRSARRHVDVSRT